VQYSLDYPASAKLTRLGVQQQGLPRGTAGTYPLDVIRGFATIGRRHTNRAPAPIAKLQDDTRETAIGAFRQHRQLVAKQGMSRVSNCDMGPHPIEDCGALQWSVTQLTPTPSSFACVMRKM
jgi:hypothetical protein